MTAVQIIRGERPMAPLSEVARRQAEILAKIEGVLQKVEEVANQGRENGNELRMLRRELGMDAPHGRIPQIEQRVDKIDIRLDNQKLCIDQLEDDRHFQRGKQWVITAIIAVLTSSGSVCLYELVLKGHLGH